MALDIGRCFSDAADVYKKNVLIAVLATLVFQLLSLFSLLILLAPLYGGYCMMMLNATRKEDKKIVLNDIFGQFNKFLPLLGLMLLQTLMTLTGFVLLIIPGFIAATLLLYTVFVMLDKNMGIIESIKASWNTTKESGFWINLALCIIYLTLTAVPGQLPFVGWIIALFVTPFAILLLTSAYIQQFAQVQAAPAAPAPEASAPQEPAPAPEATPEQPDQPQS